jgi:hypothetical protein
MKVHLLVSTLLRILFLGLLVLAGASAAEPIESGSIPIPTPPKAKKSVSSEQSCIKPIEIMRRSHGFFLKHYRHDSVRYGIRTIQDSLITCINCHVTPLADGSYPSVKKGTEHFCRSCHEYAAVTIDCFQCHTDHPEEETFPKKSVQ